jgi:hypothetical protein
VMGDVSAKMLGEFADRLEANVLSQSSAPESAEPDEPVTDTLVESAAESEPPSIRTIHSAPAEPVDLLGTAGPSVAKRLLPLVGALGLVWFFWWRHRRHAS